MTSQLNKKLTEKFKNLITGPVCTEKKSDKMLTLNSDTIWIQLPKGKTESELIDQLYNELSIIQLQMAGVDLNTQSDINHVSRYWLKFQLETIDIKINGEMSNGMALYLGNKLGSLCKSVSIFDKLDGAYHKIIGK